MTSHHPRIAAAVLGAVALFSAPTAAQSATFCEQDGLIVIQIESAPAASGWAEETSAAGFTGDSYYRWTGGNQFNNPGLGVMTYLIEVTNPGTYNLRVRNLHTDPDPTEENDCWTRLDGGQWNKTYSKFNNVWNWSTRFDPENGAADYDAEYFLSAGTHVFQVSGRSQNFRIDRMHFYLPGTPDPEDIGDPETVCVDSGWIDLGDALAGTNGAPTLSGDGPLTQGSLTTLSIDNGLGGAPAFLVLGVSNLSAPFKGGVMVPEPDFAFGPLPLSATGEFDLQWAWGPLPSGASLYWQTWIADAGGPLGLAATNGLESIAP